MSSATLDLNGYTDLPDEKIALVVTFLEMTAPPVAPLAGERQDVSLERWVAPDVADYKRLFREIGEDWLWCGRLMLSDDRLKAVLTAAGNEVYTPVIDGRQMGLLEIDYSDPENPELAYFGLVPSAVGSGLGRWLMQQAMAMVWSRPPSKRFWLHTCTGDSPQAIGFYRSCGFKPYKRAIEVMDDPRATGLLAKDKGPHVPYLASPNQA